MIIIPNFLLNKDTKNEVTQETYEINLTDESIEKIESEEPMKTIETQEEFKEEKSNPLMPRKKRSTRSSLAKEKEENSDTSQETQIVKPKSASDTQDSMNLNKKKCTKANQIDRKLDKQVESPIGPDQVARVTRSRSKIGQNQGVASPASSTSSNK